LASASALKVTTADTRAVIDYSFALLARGGPSRADLVRSMVNGRLYVERTPADDATDHAIADGPLQPDALRVALSRTLADRVDGVDVHGYGIGDVIDLPSADARSLIAKAWAIPDRRQRDRPHTTERRRAHATADERSFDRTDRE